MSEKANPGWSKIWCPSIGTQNLMLQAEKMDLQGTWRHPKSRRIQNTPEPDSDGCYHFITRYYM
jgi:hypothetical protein